MKSKLLNILLCSILIIGITGCKQKKEYNLNNTESFSIGTTLDDGRLISFTFDIPYKNSFLNEALLYNEITIDKFISLLDFVSDLNDGGSKLYKYSQINRTFGNKDFYVLVCNSYDGIKDIYVAKNTNSLTNKCVIKIDDLEGVSMTIKDGTLTNVGATIVIKDISSRNNIYGEPYEIDTFIDGKWKPLTPIIDNYAWTAIGYRVNEDNKLELDINWEWLYGQLQPGTYRIVKSTSIPGEGTEHYITTEFTIE